MYKRKNDDPFGEVQLKRSRDTDNVKKNSLDSDEEDDSEDPYNVLDEDLIPDEEAVCPEDDNGDVRTTAFNMKEELEEGHFDKDGHFIWKKDKELRDNWLDNIDWHQIKRKGGEKGTEAVKGLGEESSDDEEDFNDVDYYKKIITFLQPKENIAKALTRLGGKNKKLSSVERLKLRKAGIVQATNEQVVELTELANTILNKTGNMDVYQETYEGITRKIAKQNDSKKQPESLDMYSDDFDEKEKQRLDEPGTSRQSESPEEALMWEYRWNTDDSIQGPFTSRQMMDWVHEGKFKNGCLVRKIGQDQFYSIHRIDFELYVS